MTVRYALTRESNRPLVLAIGFFDGMHLGHREIARTALRLRKPGWRAGVLTFARHPYAFLRPGTEPPLLATSRERLTSFGEVGYGECFFISFDERIASMTPRAFLDLLLAQLGVRALVVGETFRFGHRRAGDVTLMHEVLAPRGVDVVALPSVCVDGERVSSTRIRAHVERGEMERADVLLGRPYELRGQVEVGAGRGHDLGFPTANIRPPEKMLPKDGIYAALARHDGRDYAALVSIGKNPHFGAEARTVEVWLRDFRRTIYGHELAVRDLRFLREQREFASTGELTEQMHRDLESIAYPTFS
jgi:riboflavin kinase / FMN adenylyltransferase